MGCVAGLKADKADAPRWLVCSALCALLCASSQGKTLPGTTRVMQHSVPALGLCLLPWSWAGLLCFVLAGRDSSAAPKPELSSATAFEHRKPLSNLQTSLLLPQECSWRRFCQRQVILLNASNPSVCLLCRNFNQEYLQPLCFFTCLSPACDSKIMLSDFYSVFFVINISVFFLLWKQCWEIIQASVSGIEIAEEHDLLVSNFCLKIYLETLFQLVVHPMGHF